MEPKFLNIGAWTCLQTFHNTGDTRQITATVRNTQYSLSLKTEDVRSKPVYADMRLPTSVGSKLEVHGLLADAMRNETQLQAWFLRGDHYELRDPEVLDRFIILIRGATRLEFSIFGDQKLKAASFNIEGIDSILSLMGR